ncbi:MAG: hypothetical protein WCD18_21020 [Thermosynechococcaceae cyanobacterium]
MAKGRGRPGGNPDLVQHQFTTDRAEPCSERLQVRLPRSLKERIMQQPDWPDWVRETLEKNLVDSL